MPFNSLFSWLIKKRIHQIDLFKKYPFDVQKETLMELVHRSVDTDWGKKHNYAEIESYDDFNKNAPLTDYEVMKPYVERMLKNEQNLMWNTDIKWFAKSSGTTSARSKFIPVSKESLEDCHYKAGKDLLSIYYNAFPDSKVYKGKNLVLGGSAEINYLNSNSYFGDLSAIILENLPWWAEIKRTPAKEIALMSKWEEKIEKLANSTVKQDITLLVGVPSWTLVLCNRVLEITGKSNLREVWPNLELFMHGGVNFEPYRAQFKKLIPFDDMHYVETYNASEGFFGIQDDLSKKELLLMLDYGIFFEFIPMDAFDGIHSKQVIRLQDVEIGVNYALVISTNGGLWRYIIGDTIRFTSSDPFRFKITGRTKSFINAFGEELVVENAEQGIRKACEATGAQISDYSAAPLYMEDKKGGGHEWLIEFNQQPDDLEHFITVLDDELKAANSDYEAKRTGNLSLQRPVVRVAQKGLFESWLKANEKLGGQHKIPRLSNNRKLMDDFLTFLTEPNLGTND